MKNDLLFVCVDYREEGLTLCKYCVKPIAKDDLVHELMCKQEKKEQRQEAEALQSELLSERLAAEESKGPPRPQCDETENQTVPYKRRRSEGMVATDLGPAGLQS